MSDKHYFFCGIGGSGMSPLAQYLVAQGCKVSGSDRNFDQGRGKKISKTLSSIGVNLYPQDGSGISDDIDILVASTAVEKSIPDIKVALDKGIDILKRPELLAKIFHQHRGIAVGGTSGKSTTTALIGHILNELDRDPLVINGAVMRNFEDDKNLGNCHIGDGKYCVIEADESNGTIDLYNPFISIVTNISLDHKIIEELVELFSNFIKRTTFGTVLNLNCQYASKLKHLSDNVVTFAIDNDAADLNAKSVKSYEDRVEFELDNIEITLPMAGKHNVENLLSALSVIKLLNIDIKEAIKTLSSFKGVERRMEIIGKSKEITVIDDFAHNPDKIAAALKTVKERKGRVIAFFQPHGFGPTKFLRKAFVKSFIENTDDNDIIIMPEIFFAGGTVTKDISTKDIIDDLKNNNRNAFFFENRSDIPEFVKENAISNDRVIIMGARDMSLSLFAKDVFNTISKG